MEIEGRGGNDSLTGGTGGADTIDGGAGADMHRRCGDGDDTIDGGAGADMLTGGGGNDTFMWGNGDTIKDFDIDWTAATTTRLIWTVVSLLPT